MNAGISILDVLASKIGQLDPEQLCHVAFVYGRFEQVHPSLHEALESRMGKVMMAADSYPSPGTLVQIFVLTPQGGSGYPTHGPLPIPSLCDLTISVAILDLQWIGQRAYLEEMFSAVDWDEISLPGSISSRSVSRVIAYLLGRVSAALARLGANPPLSAFRRASGSTTEVCDWLAACGDLADRGYSLDLDLKNIIM